MNTLHPLIKTADLLVLNNQSKSLKSSNLEPSEKSCHLIAISGLVYPINSQPALYNFKHHILPEFREDLEDLKGQWVALLYNKRKNEFKVMSDHFGFQSIFYRHDKIEDGQYQLIVSTNYNSLIEYSKNNNLACNTNYEQFYLAMAAKNLNLRTAFSTQTFCQEIQLLGVDEYITFNSQEWNFKVIKKPFLYDPESRSYDELLNVGISKAKKDIVSLKNYFNDKRIFLSGGKDSRMVLALLSSLNINSDFTSSMANPTKFVGNSKKIVLNDLYVSTYLSNKYNIQPCIPSQYCSLTLNYTQCLSKALSNNSQFSWASTVKNTEVFPKEQYLALRGGGGELIRATETSNNAIRRLESTSIDFKKLSIREQADLLFYLYIDTKLIPNKYLEGCKDLFVKSYIIDASGSLEQNIDWHYLYYRNRIHFGHYVKSFSENEIAFHPLMQKEFLYASAHYNLETKRDGKICFDVINKLDYKLNQITFDNGFWPIISEKQSPTIEELSKNNSLLDSYFEVQEKIALNKKEKINLSRSSSKIKSEEIVSPYRIYLNTINILFELFCNGNYSLTQLKHLIENIHTGKISPSEFFLKYLDYRNLFDSYFIPTNTIIFNKPAQNKFLPLNSILAKSKLLSHKSEFIRNVKYDLSVSKNLEFKVILSENITNCFSKIQYAFYLYENGSIVERKMYEENNVYIYESLDGNKSYQVRFFLKMFKDNKNYEIIYIKSDNIRAL